MTSAMSCPRRIHRHRFARAVLLSILGLVSYSGQTKAQNQAGPFQSVSSLAWSTESTGTRRFVSVHGRRAAIFGYPQRYAGDYPAAGLEVWAYPVQILSSYSVTFRQQGTTTGIDGQTILRRIVYSPEAVTRVYAGPDFIVREKLFVPLDETGAIIRYEAESAHPIDIEIRFIPVLDLMWPASIGGQDAVWSSAASAYLLSELTHRFTASVGSPDIVAHDETPNSGQSVGRAPGFAFTIRAGGGNKHARVIIAGSGPTLDASVIARKLLEDGDSLEKAAVEHYDDLLRHALRIETPDADTNRALAWSEIALDQAWVCNPDLGCGLVAGYGPSRGARRPQYDWFFAGDAMVSIQALLAEGEYDRAREELEFILKRQDQKTGMVWHELSQSAGLLDWSSYPYMFVHVDLTFDFLNTIGNYFSTTGDRDFVKAHWASIESAYAYCRSLVDAKDGLPRIPPDKEGASEQDALTDELSLSGSWAGAAQAFADLSAAMGHSAEAAQASTDSLQAIRAIGQRYWDERRHSWITGYTRSGTPLIDRGITSTHVRGKALFSQVQIDSLIGQLASSDFQADWGTRGIASSAVTYDPNSYSRGSVWALSTSGTASEFWAEHRPATALPIWRALVPWSSLDSLGHMHEVVAGNFYHEEVESVPEQTWSSAGFFASAVNGLLGLQVDGVSKRVTFAPHLPPEWTNVTLRNLHAGTSEISVRLFQSATELRLEMQNDGDPVEVVFNPEIPLGAKLQRAQFGGRPVTATIEGHPQDAHAKVEVNLPHGSMSLTMDYEGGVALVPDQPQLAIAEPSNAIKITGVNLRGGVYTVDFDNLSSATSGFELRTPWRIKDAQGATFEKIAPALYRLTVSMPRQGNESDVYQHGKVIVTFAHKKSD